MILHLINKKLYIFLNLKILLRCIDKNIKRDKYYKENNDENDLIFL